jgi:hypothetical protein
MRAAAWPRRASLVLALLLAGAAAPAKDAKNLTDREKSERAAEALVKMREALTAVERRVEDARQQRDVLLLNCVNERRASIVGLLKVAELALDALRGGVRERQREVVDAEFARIDAAHQRVETARLEAVQCTGLAGDLDERVERVVTDDNKLQTAKSDPTQPEPEPPPDYRAPPASPTK